MKRNFKFSIIAADTSRTRAYLNVLALNGFIPQNAIILKDENKKLKNQNNLNFVQDKDWPEANFDQEIPIEYWFKKLSVPFKLFCTRDINDNKIIDYLKTLDQKLFIFSGYGGTILRKKILSTEKLFLHVHGGYLPNYKGSTTNYYSIINDNEIGASAIILDANIDSGPIIFRNKFPANINKKNIDYVYDAAVRSRILIEALKILEINPDFRQLVDHQEYEFTYYIIHPVLKHIAILN